MSNQSNLLLIFAKHQSLPGMNSVFKEYLQANTQITDEQFELLRTTQNLSTRSFEKGKILLRAGDTSGVTYFVTQGLLRSYTITSNDKEHIVQFAPENWWIGDRNNAYFNEPASFYIDVVEDAQVVCLEKAFMEQAQDICPDFARYNIYLLQNNIRHMQQRVAQLLGASAEERYLDFIRLYPNVSLRVPQMMIASYLGITPESLSRVRKELARKHYNK